MVTVAPLAQDLRLITAAEYHQMAAAGILAADEQVELLAGHIIQKMPKGPAHRAFCKRLEKLLERALGEEILVRLQDPIQLDPLSEPEPDIAIVQPRDDFYETAHPKPDEVYWLIEIADTTIKRDLGLKADLYAAAGINDYWVLNIATRQLHVFREPQTDGYQRQTILQNQQSVEPLRFPTCSLSVNDCFGKTL